jgi:hypothetical protein
MIPAADCPTHPTPSHTLGRSGRALSPDFCEGWDSKIIIIRADTLATTHHGKGPTSSPAVTPPLMPALAAEGWRHLRRTYLRG